MAKFVPIKPPKDVTPPDSLWGEDGGGTGAGPNADDAAGAVILKGFGKNGEDLTFASSTALRAFYNRLIQRKDPRLKQVLKAFGINKFDATSIKLGREIWNDAVSWSFNVAKPGKAANFFKVATSDQFVNFGLDIPKKYLTGGGGSGGPSQQSYINITTKKEARDLLRQAMVDMLGREPSNAEYNDFVTKLNKAENKTFKTTRYTSTEQRTTGRMIDPKAFAEQYALKKVSFKEDLAGGAGLIQDSVNQLINMNGLNGFVTDKKKREWMRALAKGDLTNETLMASIRDESKKVYSAFAGLLDANPTMSLYDVADPYVSVYSRMFELGEAQVDFSDVLKKAVKVGPDGKESLMSVFEYQKALRTDPKFQYTSTAKNEAQDMGTAFARAFGVNI